MSTGIKEIEKLNADAEYLIDMDARHGELENRIAISDKIANVKLTQEKKETDDRKDALGRKNTAMRNRLQKSRHEEFIIDLPQPHDEVGLRKYRSPPPISRDCELRN